MRRQVRVGGMWLRQIGAFDQLTVVHSWPHGSEECTWTMRPTTSHPLLDRGGALVEVFDGGVRTWWGKLTEPSGSGEYAAHGGWSQAAGVYALDGSGNATNTVDTAVDAARPYDATTNPTGRGAVSWTRPASLLSTAWGTPGEPMKLGDLLDQALAGQGLVWYVDADGAVRASANPTTPNFYVPRAVTGRSLTLAEDDYYSHLVGTYLATGPVYATVTVGDATAAARWGYKEAPVDLTGMGIITSGTATSELNARLALTGARLGYAENLELGFGQITTPGGTPVALTEVRAGHVLRLLGVADRTRPSGDVPVTDVVIARSSYIDGAATVQLTPMGKAPRNLQEVITRTP